MIKKEKKGTESTLIQNNKITDKNDNRVSDKVEKNEKIADIKSEKTTRPVKLNKNRHQFVVSGKILFF